MREAAAELDGYFTNGGDEDPYELQAELQSTMQDDVGIFRDEAGLAAALGKLEELQGAASANVHVPGRRARLQPAAGTSAVTSGTCSPCAEAITRAALLRAGEPRRAQPARLPASPSDYWGRAQHRRRTDGR